LLEEARRRIEPVAERKSVSVVCEVAPAPLLVLADRERILEVLSNLTDNAVRYSPDGETVTVSAQQEADQVLFAVRDRGPGILPQDRPRVFERFYTGDRARSEGRGTGLGLAIARHIVSRHGGEIWVGDSSRGATLYFTLPAATAAP
jgi:signal transduction histidine kinase